jgi:hypothetical protein
MSDALFQQMSSVQDITQPVPQTIASATTISPTTFLTFITGAVAISTINPFTTGAHMICLIFTNGSPAAFSVAGNVKTAIQPIQNLPVFLIYDPVTALWWGAPGLLT